MALFALFAATGIAPEPAAAVLRPSGVTVSAKPDTLLVGERLHYVITVRHQGQAPLSVVSLAAGQGTTFEIIGTKSNTKKLPDGEVEFSMDTELAVFSLGSRPLPHFTVLAGNGSAAEGNRLDVTPSGTITVLSATDATIKDLRPIVPPVSAPFPTWMLAPLLITLLLLLLTGLIIRALLRTLLRHLDDPVRAARKKLRAIRRQLSKGVTPETGYESLSNILREFLQKRYNFGAMEMVTQEIAEELTNRRIRTRHDLLRLLDQADLVKFADRRPEIEECRRSLRVAELLVATPTEMDETDDSG